MRGTWPLPCFPLAPVLHVSEEVGMQQQVPVQLQVFPKSLLGPVPGGGDGGSGSVLLPRRCGPRQLRGQARAETVPACPARLSRPAQRLPARLSLGKGTRRWLPEPGEALFHQGLIQEQGLQPLIVPGAFQEVQVADILRTEDTERWRTAARGPTGRGGPAPTPRCPAAGAWPSAPLSPRV